jgi:transcriptional regulator with XRE-family HTH domain
LAARELSRLVGANVRAARKARGIRQKTLAAAIGISRPQLSRRELGIDGIKVGELLRLAAALDLDAGSLLPPSYFPAQK